MPQLLDKWANGWFGGRWGMRSPLSGLVTLSKHVVLTMTSTLVHPVPTWLRHLSSLTHSFVCSLARWGFSRAHAGVWSGTATHSEKHNDRSWQPQAACSLTNTLQLPCHYQHPQHMTAGSALDKLCLFNCHQTNWQKWVSVVCSLSLFQLSLSHTLCVWQRGCYSW